MSPLSGAIPIAALEEKTPARVDSRHIPRIEKALKEAEARDAKRLFWIRFVELKEQSAAARSHSYCRCAARLPPAAGLARLSIARPPKAGLNGPQAWSTLPADDRRRWKKRVADQWFLIGVASLGWNPSLPHMFTASS